MKKRELVTLAMLGIGAGLLVGGCQKKGEDNRQAVAEEQMSPDMQSFYIALSSTAKQKFLQLDAQHKMMAIEMSQQNCSGKNACKSMGGCATSQNACAAENSCKGQGGAPVQDPNKAVEKQYKNQTEQRKKTNNGVNPS